MNLPRITEEGVPYISYSQISTWIGKEAFNKVIDYNTGNLKSVSGKTGYILRYFFNYDFPPSPMDVYAPFGILIEDAICNQEFSCFTTEEQEILKSITPLGVFQYPVKVEFDGFTLNGYIDDMAADFSIIRDYKTGSIASTKKYSKPEYDQLNMYALDIYRKTGKIPEAEVSVILRSGSHLNMPMRVSGVQTIKRNITMNDLYAAEAKIISTAKEIAECYTIFCEVFKK